MFGGGGGAWRPKVRVRGVFGGGGGAWRPPKVRVRGCLVRVVGPGDLR